MELSIIIVGYHCFEDIGRCVESIRNCYTDVLYEIIVVNNYKDDERLPAFVARHPEILILDDGINKGFGRANNVGLRAAKGKYICFLNPDVIVLKSIRPLMERMEADGTIGIVGPLLRNTDRSVQQSCNQLPTPKNWFAFVFSLNKLFPKVTFWGNYPRHDFSYQGETETGWVSGAFILTTKAIMDQVGGFDDRFFMYCEDTDLCWMVHDAGYKILFSDASEAIHIGGVVTPDKSENQTRMIAKSTQILWRKYYDEKTTKRMLQYTFVSAKLKRLCYRLSGLLGSDRAQKSADHFALLALLVGKQLAGIC